MSSPAPPVLLAIDPGTQTVGYAVLKDLGPDGLVEAGKFKGSQAMTPYNGLPEPLRSHLRHDDMKCVRRVLDVRRDLIDALELFNPTTVVVEIPSGKAGTGSKRGGSGSLTTYGMAAGWMAGTVMGLGYDIESFVPINERQWTSKATGCGIKKAWRPIAVRDLYPCQYNPASDDGSDIADAILLGRWWMQQVQKGGA